MRKFAIWAVLASVVYLGWWILDGADVGRIWSERGHHGSFWLAVDTVVLCAGQEPQRKADDSGGMAAHPLDGEIGLAGVGGAENRPNRCLEARHYNLECGSARRKRKFPILNSS